MYIREMDLITASLKSGGRPITSPLGGIPMASNQHQQEETQLRVLPLRTDPGCFNSTLNQDSGEGGAAGDARWRMRDRVGADRTPSWRLLVLLWSQQRNIDPLA